VGRGIFWIEGRDRRRGVGKRPEREIETKGMAGSSSADDESGFSSSGLAVRDRAEEVGSRMRWAGS